MIHSHILCLFTVKIEIYKNKLLKKLINTTEDLFTILLTQFKT